MSDMFIDRTSAFLAKTLDGSTLRQTILADNIANADTPGFTRKELNFEEQLVQAASEQLDPDQTVSDIENMPFDPEQDVKSPRRADGNNVDIEKEMTTMAKNSLQYDSSADLLNMKISMLKLAIHEGRR